MKDAVYLDYNASAPLRPTAAELMGSVLREAGNASSVHSFGRAAHKHIETARAQVAALVNVEPNQIIFNSGATESNTTILQGFKNRRIIVSSIEHPSVLESAPEAERIPVTPDGVVDLAAFEALLNKGETPALVSVMLVNNETGVIQPVSDIARLAKNKGALVHTDAVQAAGRIDLDLDRLGVDYLSLSAHKIAGPQGVGALVFKTGLQVPRLMYGGGHERRQRAGTQNVAGIAGFGVAAALALQELKTYPKLAKFRDHLEAEVRKISRNAVIYGANTPRVANTSNIGLPGVPAETQIMALDLAGVAVSSGSACSSGTMKASHVLMAMGASETDARSALRISLGWATEEAHVTRFLNAWEDMANRILKN